MQLWNELDHLGSIVREKRWEFVSQYTWKSGGIPVRSVFRFITDEERKEIYDKLLVLKSKYGINEIKIVPNVDSEKVKKLWDNCYKKSIGNRENINELARMMYEHYPSYIKMSNMSSIIPFLEKDRLKILYNNLKEFQNKYNIQEIKVTGNITPEMVKKLYNELYEDQISTSLIMELRNIFSKYGINYLISTTPSLFSKINILPQIKLKQLYQDLLELQNKYK